jgi:MarR family transcriptional regulator, negative regulator of the multidrug operon emrRAB
VPVAVRRSWIDIYCMHTSHRAARQANLLGALAIAVVDRLHEAKAEDDGRALTATAALSHLRLRPGQNIDFLARLLHISHPATVRLVNRLEADGLAERRPDEDDARSRALVLTPAGQRAALAAARKRLKVLDQMLSPLTTAERRQLEPVLERLLGALTTDRWDARHICRLCDIPACHMPTCPVDQAVPEPGLPIHTVPATRQ